MASDAAILAIDTAAAQCAVAFVSGDRVLRRVERVQRGHAELLFPLIEAVLAEAGAGLHDLSLIVCCTGPGSFAGTRIGVAAARGLALALGRPAVGVTRFQALAAEAQEHSEGAVGVVLAGRGDTAFFQAFDPTGRPIAEPRTISASRPEPGLLVGIDRLAGDGAEGWSDGPCCLTDGLPDPAVLARLGAADATPLPPAPLYLRPPDADLPREGPPRMLD